MPFSEPEGQTPPPGLVRARWDRLQSALYTAVLSLAVFALALAGSVPVQDASGAQRSVRILTLVRLAMRQYPAQAPVFLNRDVLLVLSILAVPAGAYMLVATWRLRSP